MTKTAKQKASDAIYEAKPEQIANRIKRNAARRKLMAEGKVHKGDGKEVDHKQMLANGGGNTESNLRVVSEAKNRAWRKGKTGSQT